MTKQTTRLDDGQPQNSPSQEQAPNDQENAQAQESQPSPEPQEDKAQSLIDSMLKIFATKVEVQEQPVPLPTQEEAPRKLDKTIPGGKYRNASGQLVNANGELIDENGKVLK